MLASIIKVVIINAFSISAILPELAVCFYSAFVEWNWNALIYRAIVTRSTVTTTRTSILYTNSILAILPEFTICLDST